jgi:hypothetical protein
VVYKAEFHGTLVAVKTYVGDDPTGELMADWSREISNLAKLHHVSFFLIVTSLTILWMNLTFLA